MRGGAERSRPSRVPEAQGRWRAAPASGISDAVNAYPYSARVQVRWGDMDALGHVNNAVYFTYCETARMRWLEALALPDLAAGEGGRRVGFGLVSTAMDFKRQVRPPADIDVGLRVSRIGGKSFTTEYGLVLVGGDPETVATGSAVLVWMDFDARGGKGEALPLPEALRSRLAAYVVV